MTPPYQSQGASGFCARNAVPQGWISECQGRSSSRDRCPVSSLQPFATQPRSNDIPSEMRRFCSGRPEKSQGQRGEVMVAVSGVILPLHSQGLLSDSAFLFHSRESGNTHLRRLPSCPASPHAVNGDRHGDQYHPMTCPCWGLPCGAVLLPSWVPESNPGTRVGFFCSELVSHGGN